ncbi:PGPGW domain-containing protein [Phenylobacterium sp.]|uniref:PGPGW domain-containing protein n=1 Tax=Phenylobacterium sp. TaxID=1871053 RepID=UPI00273258F6|nr:PGPGW domain-containing protein [Phenylobacterium sp.]MDP3173521.1 PGPGW domain-containing protein [Phenylobacterium sp.]MDP3658774.1 PGPGW domain-containing protein [Phenylobacterium sp.]
MSLTLTMPRARNYASDDVARELVARVLRPLLVLLGVLVIMAGVAIAPLPGPGGLPVIVVGLMLVLRNSFKARRHFVRFQRAHPKMVFPIRRLLRREPEVLPVAWQQTLRIERLVLPRRLRFVVRSRRYFRRRRLRRAEQA